MSGTRKGKSFKSRFNSILIVALVMLIPAFLVIGNFIQIFSLNQEISSLDTQISSAQEKSKQLDDDIAQIGSQSYIEKIARKYLGLYYPNEKIVIPQEAKNTGTGSKTTATETDSTGAAETTDSAAGDTEEAANSETVTDTAETTNTDSGDNTESADTANSDSADSTQQTDTAGEGTE